MSTALDLYKTSPKDELLFGQLGLMCFANQPHDQELHVGFVPLSAARVSVFVTCLPAQFWRFRVITAERQIFEVRTGSGCLSDYWPSVCLVAKGLLTMKEVPA